MPQQERLPRRVHTFVRMCVCVLRWKGWAVVVYRVSPSGNTLFSSVFLTGKV